jgi:methyl-accepting chemotaxis protein
MLKKMLSVFGLTQVQREEIRHEIDLFEAITAHANWKKRLIDYIEGNSSEDLQPHNICVDNRCVLGTWIHGNGKARFGDYLLFQQLVEEHAKFHFYASKVVEAHQAGDDALAHKLLNENFIGQSRKTVNCLAKLNAEIDGQQSAA